MSGYFDFRVIQVFNLSLVLVILMASFPQAVAAFEKVVLGSVVSVIPQHSLFKNNASNPMQKGQVPEGSAVAIFPGGFLVTNAHVLGSAKSIDIRLADGRLIKVEIIGKDPFTDIALLKAPLDFPTLKPAKNTEISNRVCAIGNQFGLGLSVTCGVVSAKHRTGTGFNPIEDFIQTDAAVNPGGSGGALVNERGQIVGLISAIFTKESDSNIGVNFATSVEMVLRVARDLRDFGRVVRGKSGIRVGALSNEQRRTKFGVPITHVKEDGAGFKSGLRPGNIITKIGNRIIRRPTDVSSAFHKFRPGESVKIEFFDKETRSLTEIILSP